MSRVFLLALLSVALSAMAQLAFKSGMMRPEMQALISAPMTWGERVFTILLNPWVLGGLGLYALSAVIWLFVLARLDLSIAYPFVGLGFVITMVMGALLFGESLSLYRVLGTLLVCAGVVLVARS